MTTYGNISLLEGPIDGFLCSRSTKSSVILPCLDWAAEHAKGTIPVMSTFHSEMEKAVWDILTPGTCPIILVLGRSLYKKIPNELQTLLDNNRLLIVSITERRGINRESAALSNKFICDTAATLTFGFVSPESSLYPLCQEASSKKPTKVLTTL